MPIQVQRRPSDPLPMGPTPGGSTPGDQLATAKAQHQQQQQHREALRLALGSILTPKRPPILPASRSSSGTATPAHPSPWLSGPVSGAQTPAGTPPTSSPYLPASHGPNSSEHLLHPHHAFGHHGHPHPLPPSKLGRSSSSSNSPIESIPNSGHNSAQPSPRPGIVSGTGAPGVLPHIPDVEPLPPAIMAEPHTSVNEAGISANGEAKPVRPSIMPLHSSKDGNSASGLTGAGSAEGSSDAMQTEAGSQSGRGTPRAKFLQTLQSKSAWDALIHGSFS